MRAGLHITRGLISRRYDQGLDSIVRLIGDLEARIEDLTARRISKPEQMIRAQQAEIKRLEQIVANKDAELVKAHQINRQLQMRIRELEKFIEAGSTVADSTVKRDSHNSNQPPLLDLPWTKPKRTRSLRKQSGRQIGGQIGHEGVTLRQVAVPNRIVVHPNLFVVSSTSRQRFVIPRSSARTRPASGLTERTPGYMSPAPIP